MHTLRDIFDGAFVAYFMALNLAYTALLLLGSRQVSGWVRRRPLRDFRGVSAYRQWLAIARTKALWTVLRPDTGWGEMTRVGFSEPVPAVARGISSATDG